jgi:hypothetical protein
MIASRALLLIPAFLLLVLPMTADAQGRGNGNKAKNGNGPAFCRNGQGHPVHGWEWCRQKGWGDGTADSRVARSRTAVPRERGDATSDRTRGGGRINDPAFDNGYADGYEKGLDDGRDRREFDPTRHDWYRSADRNYDPSYGTRAVYANIYRDGFRSGYEAGHADGERYGDRSGRVASPGRSKSDTSAVSSLTAEA